MQSSVTHQLHLPPSAHHITCPPSCLSPSYPLLPATSPPVTPSFFPIGESLMVSLPLCSLPSSFSLHQSLPLATFAICLHFVILREPLTGSHCLSSAAGDTVGLAAGPRGWYPIASIEFGSTILFLGNLLIQIGPQFTRLLKCK